MTPAVRQACGDAVGKQAQPAADEDRNERAAQVLDEVRPQELGDDAGAVDHQHVAAGRLSQTLQLGGEVAGDARALPWRVGESAGDHDLLGAVQPAAEGTGPRLGGSSRAMPGHTE